MIVGCEGGLLRRHGLLLVESSRESERRGRIGSKGDHHRSQPGFKFLLQWNEFEAAAGDDSQGCAFWLRICKEQEGFWYGGVVVL